VNRKPISSYASLPPKPAKWEVILRNDGHLGRTKDLFAGIMGALQAHYEAPLEGGHPIREDDRGPERFHDLMIGLFGTGHRLEYEDGTLEFHIVPNYETTAA